MVTKSTTLPNRRYVWADDAAQARRKVGTALVREGLVPTIALLPPLVALWTGLTRPGTYDFAGNSVDGYKEEPANTKRRYAVDVRP